MNSSFDFGDIWEKLKNEGTAADGYFRRRYPFEKIKVFLAVESISKLPALILEVCAENIPEDIKYPESRKFSIAPKYDAAEKTVLLVLKLHDQSYTDIFKVMAEDLVGYIAQVSEEKEAVRVFIGELIRWQEFLKQYSEMGMSVQMQQGLFGELWFLKNILLDIFGSTRAVEIWQGPERANHDFQIAEQAVELKTYAGSTHPKVSISNMRQLDTEGLENLYLCVLRLDARKSTQNTLPDLVEEILRSLQSDAESLAKFKTKLAKYGYVDRHLDLYRQTGYTVIETMFYLVDENFPKISPDNLPEGIGDVTYSVILSSCTASRVSRKNAIESFGRSAL